ncbi:MAG: gliding motility-associated C-terminal domain-containing protein [Bacteroidetes bacterium]|nr:gliding motility-associated C-terminal domain-containing protein [Bacteroidota bacterium]
MKKIGIIFLVLLIGFSVNTIAQNLCNTALPFTTGTTYNFPAGVNATAGEPGPNYGCLGTKPNPAWYFLKVCTGGNIEIEMHGSGNYDIDFACWGPFTSPTTPCTALLTAGTPTPNHHAPGPGGGYPVPNMIDCSYDPSYQEWCYIPNAVAGQYYILIITNFSNQVQNIIFSQTNAGQPGSGSTSGLVMPPQISSNGPVCEGDTLKLTAGTVNGASYYWSGPNNWQSFVQNPKIPNATPSQSGTYYLLITACNEISPEISIPVVVKPKPNVIVANDTVCLGDSAVLKATGATTYKWSPGGSTADSIKIKPAANINYTVIGTALGCKDTTTATIAVRPLPVVTVNNPTICIYDTATITASGALSYLWGNGITANTISVSPPHDTNYVVVGRDVYNCLNTATSHVSINPLPSIILSQDTTICLGGSATLTAGGGIKYLWTPTNDTTSAITVSPTYTSFIYTVGVTDINNCFDSASVTVYTAPLPIPTISLEKDTICKGAYTTITATGGSSYTWSTGDISPTISVRPLLTSIYTVTVANSLNNTICSENLSIQQNVRNCNVIYVPNSFTPLGYNSVFKPIGEIVITKSYYFAIYNRWGQLLFETTDINQGWDGRFNGEYVQAGAYIYYLKIDNGYEDPFEKIGTVTLIN